MGNRQRRRQPSSLASLARLTGSTVVVNSNGKLGVTASSARFKDEIKPMNKASEAILALRPVTFRYKQEIDPEGIPQFGLMGEDVEKVNPDLVARIRAVGPNGAGAWSDPATILVA